MKYLQDMENSVSCKTKHCHFSDWPIVWIFQKILKVSVKENEVPTEKNSSSANIFATKASYISN